MKERHFTKKELLEAKPDPLTFIISTLYDLGSPIELKSLTKTPLTYDNFTVTGHLECHLTRNGEVTYLWGDDD